MNLKNICLLLLLCYTQWLYAENGYELPPEHRAEPEQRQIGLPNSMLYAQYCAE